MFRRHEIWSYFFSGYKEANKVCFVYLQSYVQENGRKNVFGEKQTINKLPLTLLDVKVPVEIKQLGFSMLPRNRKGAVYVSRL